MRREHVLNLVEEYRQAETDDFLNFGGEATLMLLFPLLLQLLVFWFYWYLYSSLAMP